MIWVIDASVAIRWLLEDESHPNADAVLTKVVHSPESFVVPELFGFEVFSVIQRLHPDGMNAYTQAIIPILQSGILRQPMTEELAIAAVPFIQSGLTGYDACYAAMAKMVAGKWLTFDKRAHSLIKRHRVSCCLDRNMPKDWA
jgi:predicted nucleic acid-binding protein